MTKLLKIKKLECGFLVEDEGGTQFAYANLQKIADEICKMFKDTSSEELSVTIEYEPKQTKGRR